MAFPMRRLRWHIASRLIPWLSRALGYRTPCRHAEPGAVYVEFGPVPAFTTSTDLMHRVGALLFIERHRHRPAYLAAGDSFVVTVDAPRFAEYPPALSERNP